MLQETSPSPTEPLLFARRYAERLGIVLLVGFAMVIAFVGYDESQRTHLETAQEITAVGDPNFFTVPANARPPFPAAVTFQGRALVPVSYEKIEIRDSKMEIVGQAEGASLRIYRVHDRASLPEGVTPPDSNTFFLKIATDEYIRVQAGATGTK